MCIGGLQKKLFLKISQNSQKSTCGVVRSKMWDAKVADRPAKGIGHLVVTNICHGDHDLAF